jgi:hypothetical protein
MGPRRSCSRAPPIALTTGGGVLCWGAQYLGVDSAVGSLTPVQATGLTSGVVSLSLGADVACAVADGGVVECWGESEDNDLLESPVDDPLAMVFVPTPQPGF